MIETLSVPNDTLYNGRYQVDTGGGYPSSATYDPSSGDLFVTDEDTSELSVVSTTTESVVATIPTRTYPDGVAYDNASGLVYVAQFGWDDISVIAPTSGRILDSIPVGTGPEGLVYDSDRKELFVANTATWNMSVISTTTNRVVATVPIAGSPSALAYDPRQGEIFVNTQGTDLVEAISDATNAVIASVPVGSDPDGLIFDNSTSEVFVANSGSNNVSVVSVSTNRVVATVGGVPSPAGLAYDWRQATVYAADGNGQLVTSISDQTNSVSASISVGSHPVAAAYVGVTGELFVANSYGVNLTVVSCEYGRSTGSISLASAPASIVYDPANGDLYLGDSSSSVTGILSGTSNLVTTQFPYGSYLGGATFGVAYDSGQGEMFVTQEPLGDIGVYSAATNDLRTMITGVPGAVALAYDSGRGEIWAIDGGAYRVTAINDTNDSPVATVYLSGYPQDIAYDPLLGDLYITEPYSNNIDVVSDRTDTVVANITVSDPSAVMYDRGTNEVFVTNVYGNNVTVISAVSNSVVTTIPAGAGPLALGYDPRDGLVFVANGDSNTVTVINDTTDTVNSTVLVEWSPDDIAWDPSNGLVYVSDSGVGALSILSLGPAGESTVRFLATGLEDDAPWNVTLGGTDLTSASSSLAFQEANGSFDYSVASPDGYRARPASGVVNVTGTNQTVSIFFAAVGLFNITVRESSLPTDVLWWLNMTNGQSYASDSSSLVFQEPNGSFVFTPTCANLSYYAPSGSFQVEGAAVQALVNFTLLTYAVRFSEVGLPAGTTWGLDLAGASHETEGPTETIDLPNGTWAYRVLSVSGWHENSVPYYGNLTVEGRAFSLSPLNFSEVRYMVWANESGLPLGASWWINLTTGSSYRSPDASIVLSEPNGTVFYTMGTVDKVYAARGSDFTVAGRTLQETVVFSPVDYSIIIAETGLPIGQTWNVTLAGVTRGTAHSWIEFNETNGSYAVSLGSVSGYATSGVPLSVFVGGRNVTIAIKYSPAPGSTPGGLESGSGLSGWLPFALVGAALLAVVAVILVTRKSRHRRGGSSPVAGESGEPPD